LPRRLTLELDGNSKSTAVLFSDVKGFQHTINAPTQTFGGSSYTFTSWSDSGAQSHQIVVPDTNQTYIATFNATGRTPVAAYAFDEGTGTTFADNSGSGNNGTLSNTTLTTFGKFGRAAVFNGTSSRGTATDSVSLDLTSAMTLEAWVYPTASGGWRDVVYKGANDIYYLEGSSGPGPPAVGGTVSANPPIGPPGLPLHILSHAAATYDGVQMRLFVNGTEVANRPQSGPIAISTGALTIGSDPLYGQYFAGRIDEVRVYNIALSAGQILADMNTPIGSQQPDGQP